VLIGFRREALPLLICALHGHSGHLYFASLT
jgi:hypothetical protein